MYNYTPPFHSSPGSQKRDPNTNLICTTDNLCNLGNLHTRLSVENRKLSPPSGWNVKYSIDSEEIELELEKPWSHI